RRSRGGGKSGNPAAVAGFPSAVGKSRLLTFPRSGVFHGPFTHKLCYRAAFINSTLAQHALALLARLFRYGTLCYHGGFINLSTGIGSRLPIDTSMWRRSRRRCKSEKIRA